MDEKVLEQIKEFEDRVTDLENKINFFLFPLMIYTHNETKKHVGSSVPAVMGWIADEFRLESDNERKRFLRNLHEDLKEVLPMDLTSVSSLPEVTDEKVDLDIFDR